MEKIIIQITSGRGPVECCRVVAKVQERILEEARKRGIDTEVLENVKGELRGTLLSAAILAMDSRSQSQNKKLSLAAFEEQGLGLANQSVRPGEREPLWQEHECP